MFMVIITEIIVLNYVLHCKPIISTTAGCSSVNIS